MLRHNPLCLWSCYFCLVSQLKPPDLFMTSWCESLFYAKIHNLNIHLSARSKFAARTISSSVKHVIYVLGKNESMSRQHASPLCFLVTQRTEGPRQRDQLEQRVLSHHWGGVCCLQPRQWNGGPVVQPGPGLQLVSRSKTPTFYISTRSVK